MRLGIHPIIDIENVLPSAFLVLSKLPILRHEIENRQSKNPVETYGTLVGVRIVWGLNFETIDQAAKRGVTARCKRSCATL
jgi:hypothetical protein